MYNIPSLLLGLLGWGLGVAAICKKGCPWCIAGSLTACAAALVFQFHEIAWLVSIRDFAAIEDTIFALADVAGFLLITTAALNLAALLRGRRKN